MKEKKITAVRVGVLLLQCHLVKTLSRCIPIRQR